LQAHSLTLTEATGPNEAPLSPNHKRSISTEGIPPSVSARSRRASAPDAHGTKRVHFNVSSLEQVQHFFITDRPITINSPVDTDCRTDRTGSTVTRELDKLVISPLNFSLLRDMRLSSRVRLQSIWLCDDRSSLLGSIAVANLAYEKDVVCRFSFDNWQTVSEKTAICAPDPRPGKIAAQGYDLFVFTISLLDMTIESLESGTMSLCIRYRVNGNNYWDNNSNSNFRLRFRRESSTCTPSQRPRAITRRLTWPMKPASTSSSHIPALKHEKFSAPVNEGLLSRFGCLPAVLHFIKPANSS
jgi:hypothetical protein